MWQPISTYSMQNKIVDWNEDYETKEITNYSFCLSNFDNIENPEKAYKIIKEQINITSIIGIILVIIGIVLITVAKK